MVSDGAVVVDTREKKPYEFPGVDNITERELNVGDYSRIGYEDVFSVERKTLDDLARSLGTDRDRFEDEIRRAQSLEEFAVVIEATKDSVYKYRNSSECPNYYSNIHPNSIVGTVEKWPDKYDTLSFIWSRSRQSAAQETLRLLDKWYMSYR